MRFFIYIILHILIFVQLCGSIAAQEPPTSWVKAQGLANALNPKISLIGDFVANAGPMADSSANQIGLRETELGFQAEVDPYARADFFASFANDETPSFEEGYVALLSLPWGLRGRGGKFRANFGRLNSTHPHEYSQVSTPLVLAEFLGSDGLKDVGAEVTRAFAPWGIYTEWTYALLNGLGKSENSDPATTTVTDSDGNKVAVQVYQKNSATQRQVRNFAHVSRLRAYFDFSDAMNIDWGISGLLHNPKEMKETRMAALDVTLRWKPLQQGTFRSAIWRTEAIYSDRKLPRQTSVVTGAVTAYEKQLYRRGIYSYVEFAPIKRWKFGLRGDYVESPEAANTTLTLQDGSSRTVESAITRALSPTVTFIWSEFNRLRAEYQYKVAPGDDVEHRLFLQWTIILGPHGAHPF